ncbi:nuclear transport factor 2 family protein [Ruegeria atlantica]|uniref:nuclear transport factor 2 family protein n=1 Tax=Ruegeria atlantica TaxID=81569 RepID=UPI00249540C0|nr:hypothetical protein [Ruegeria atlantica]
MTPLEIVKSTYEGETSEENGHSLLAHLTPDAKWIEAAGFPYAGTYTGFDEIAENVFARLASEWTDYRFEQIKERICLYGRAMNRTFPRVLRTKGGLA